MTQTIEPQTSNSLPALRDALEQAERQVVRLDRENIKAFLIGLDRIDQMFAAHGQETGSVRMEETRWESLRKQIAANPKLVVTAAANAGGLVKLRSQHAVAVGSWWYLDTVIVRQRKRIQQRIGLAIGAVIVVALIWWGFTTFFPAVQALPNPPPGQMRIQTVTP